MSKQHNGAFMFKILEIVYTYLYMNDKLDHERSPFYNYESRVTISIKIVYTSVQETGNVKYKYKACQHNSAFMFMFKS